VARQRRNGLVADWVYRGQRWLQSDPTTGEANPSGSYGVTISLSAGTPNVTAQVLYDADNTQRNYGLIDPATGTWLDVDSASRPVGSDRGALIHGVDVWFSYRPSTWAVGNRLELGWRVVVADQDPDSGQAQISTSYSMFDNITNDATGQITQYANGRQNCGEGRRFDAFSDNGQRFTVRRYCKFKRRLMAQEGLFIWLETTNASVNIAQLDLFCRTLVTDSQ